MRVADTGRLRRRLTQSLLPMAWLIALVAHASATPGVAPAPVRRESGAESFSDYRTRVHNALGLVEELATVYEKRTDDEVEPGEYDDSLKKLDAKVKSWLPAKERVEWSDGSIEVDNSWLHEALEELEPEDDEKTAVGLRAVAGRLRALDARLKELEDSREAGIDRDAERGRLNSILRRPEFDRQTPQQQQSATQRMGGELAEWIRSIIRSIFGGLETRAGGSPRVSQFTLVVVVGLCLLVLLYVGRRLWLRRRVRVMSLKLKRGARVVLGEHLEADQTASDLLDEAERLARAGELRGAIRKAYVALLCELGDRGVLRLAQHKTNRDYLDAVRRAARPRLYTEMLPLTFDFELHWYGLRAATDADWQSFKTRCRTVLDSTQ